jgi:hypothetical protein
MGRCFRKLPRTDGACRNLSAYRVLAIAMHGQQTVASSHLMRFALLTKYARKGQ